MNYKRSRFDRSNPDYHLIEKERITVYPEDPIDRLILIKLDIFL
ncbi:hypothetical protein CKA32_003475 [Geitlerinema sp. FC II]|nr:hypothetical protein CKA32_003475 [Geitlerinema sp. FC II]